MGMVMIDGFGFYGLWMETYWAPLTEARCFGAKQNDATMHGTKERGRASTVLDLPQLIYTIYISPKSPNQNGPPSPPP